MTLLDLHLLMAHDEWANARVFEAVGGLTEEQFTRDLASSHPSIRDTLAHIVLVEWVWLQRWKGESPGGPPSWARTANRALLRERLSEVEAERKDFLSSLGDADLDRIVDCTGIKGEKWRQPLGNLLLHLAEHSSYHRGQVATLLRQVGAKPPEVDLLVYLEEKRLPEARFSGSSSPEPS